MPRLQTPPFDRGHAHRREASAGGCLAIAALVLAVILLVIKFTRDLQHLPYVSFSQNIGLVGATGVYSRWVCVTGGVIVLALGLVPKLAFIVASMPQCVLGAPASSCSGWGRRRGSRYSRRWTM